MPRGDQKFELELFNKCKQTEADLKATSGVLLHVSFHPESQRQRLSAFIPRNWRLWVS